MTLPLSPRADYLAWVMFTASANASIEQRVEGLHEIAGQARFDSRLTPRDLEIILGATEAWGAMLPPLCPWCGLPREHTPTRGCTGLEAK